MRPRPALYKMCRRPKASKQLIIQKRPSMYGWPFRYGGWLLLFKYLPKKRLHILPRSGVGRRIISDGYLKLLAQGRGVGVGKGMCSAGIGFKRIVRTYRVQL